MHDLTTPSRKKSLKPYSIRRLTVGNILQEPVRLDEDNLENIDAYWNAAKDNLALEDSHENIQMYELPRFPDERTHQGDMCDYKLPLNDSTVDDFDFRAVAKKRQSFDEVYSQMCGHDDISGTYEGFNPNQNIILLDSFQQNDIHVSNENIIQSLEVVGDLEHNDECSYANESTMLNTVQYIENIRTIQPNVHQNIKFLMDSKNLECAIMSLRLDSYTRENIADNAFSAYILKGCIELVTSTSDCSETTLLSRFGLFFVEKGVKYTIRGKGTSGSEILLHYVK